MKRLWIFTAFTALLFTAGCNGGQDARDNPEQITDDPLKQQEIESDTTLQEVEEVTVKAVGEELQSMDFDQDTIEVKAGSLVRLELINEGKDPKMIYNIVFTKDGYSAQAAQNGSQAGASGNYLPDSSMMFAATPLALPGQTVRLEFTAPEKAGIYEFVNTYPSEVSSMKGKLVVK